jgi:hypothetical protein
VKAIKIWGGLGNQMFQYSFGKYIKEYFNEEVFFYLIDNEQNINSLPLLKYNVTLNFLPFEKIKKYFILNGNGLLYRLERKTLLYFPWLNRNIYVEPTLFFNRNIERRPVMFDGYWQSFKYFNLIEHAIRKDLTLKTNPWLNHKFLLDIQSSNSVSIHIRRGDYLIRKNIEIYSQCIFLYYEKAIESILSSVNNPHFFVFSNDINWASNYLKTRYNVKMTFIDNKDYKENTHLDLFLMSMCKHNIIANSTFSWWGAWLNTNTDGIVIAPKNWYNGQLNDTIKDLIPEKWIML